MEGVCSAQVQAQNEHTGLKPGSASSCRRPLPILISRKLSAVNIFLDESGSFVSAASQNSWNCIAAYLTPELDWKRLREVLASLKRAAGASVAREIKLN